MAMNFSLGPRRVNLSDVMIRGREPSWQMLLSGALANITTLDLSGQDLDAGSLLKFLQPFKGEHLKRLNLSRNNLRGPFKPLPIRHSIQKTPRHEFRREWVDGEQSRVIVAELSSQYQAPQAF
jgi:hypothetical protein